MGRFFLVKVRVPEEYEDVNVELAFSDFVDNPAAWEIELKSDKVELE